MYRVIASDIDQGENGTVSYSLPMSGDRAMWHINSVTGDIYIKSDWPSANEVSVKVSQLS